MKKPKRAELEIEPDCYLQNLCETDCPNEGYTKECPYIDFEARNQIRRNT